MTDTRDTGDVNGPENPTGDMAIVGEGSDLGHPISMKALQAVYGEITGKIEELSKRYNKPFQVSFADLAQLNHKMTQVCEQYNIEAQNTSVTVYHLDDTKEAFSSFERFRIYNQSATSPVESVVLKYNFLIVLPRTRKAQSYTVSIRVASRIVALAKMKREMSSFPPQLFRIMGGSTAIVTINYVDYMVARNLLVVADSWFESLTTADTPRWFEFIRRRSEIFRSIGKYALSGLLLLLVLRVLPSQIDAGASLQMLARFLILAASALFIADRFGLFIGAKVEHAIDSWQELGYLHLNRGDENEIETTKRSNRHAAIRAVVSGAAAFVIGFVASLAAKWLSQ